MTKKQASELESMIKDLNELPPLPPDKELYEQVYRHMREVQGFGAASQRVEKKWSYSVPTAALQWQKDHRKFSLLVNPFFWNDMEKKGKGQTWVLCHELLHLMLRHYATADRISNVAADAAINCTADMRGYLGDHAKAFILPECDHFKQPCENLQTSTYYAMMETEESKQSKQGGTGEPVPGQGKGFAGYVDPNPGDIPQLTPDDEQIADIQCRSIARSFADALRKAGMGNCDLLMEIEKVWSPRIPWENILRQFTGTRAKAQKSRTYFRPSRKHPNLRGKKVSRTPLVHVYVDQSGSVDNGLLSTIYGALESLSKTRQIYLFPFTDTVGELHLISKGTVPRFRWATGGTSFDAVVEHANKTQPDCIIIATDMGDSAPTIPSAIPRMWLTYETADKSPAGSDTVITFPNPIAGVDSSVPTI